MDLEMILTWNPKQPLDSAESLSLTVNIHHALEGFEPSYSGPLKDSRSAKEFIKSLITCTGLGNMISRTVKREINNQIEYLLGPPDEESSGRLVYRVKFPDTPDTLANTEYLKSDLKRLSTITEKKFYIFPRNELVDEPSYFAFEGEGSWFAKSSYPGGDFCERLAQFGHELEHPEQYRICTATTNFVYHKIMGYLPYDENTLMRASIDCDSQAAIDAFKQFAREKLAPAIMEYKRWETDTTRENLMDIAQTQARLRDLREIVDTFKHEHNVRGIYLY